MAWYWIVLIVLGGIAAWLSWGFAIEWLRYYVWGLASAGTSFFMVVGSPILWIVIVPFALLVRAGIFSREVNVAITDMHDGYNTYRQVRSLKSAPQLIPTAGCKANKTHD